MNTQKNLHQVKPHLTASEPVVMASSTRRKLKAVSKLFKGQEMFPEKVERAKQMFKGIQVLSV